MDPRFPPMASGSHHFSSSKLFPQLWTPYCRNQEWGIYGLIYHYAPFFLRNPMVTLSRLHSNFQSLVINPSVHFEGKTYLTKVGNAWWNPEGHSRVPTPLLSSFGYFTPGLFKELFQVVAENPDGFKPSSIPWTIQSFQRGCIQEICMALTLLGQFIFHCGIKGA
ncbi:hypothetical protein O181_128423 [Austropuccinia psidii MF-1]|uniref:Uncharacterized protein n=1 Tax=Austropuccinia psidii MF-1 TaxID=1389203 RepID=A0A9Q3Q7V3_9BASI|nr:hypothetical protein [Austropuccinia psidii MF-1]